MRCLMLGIRALVWLSDNKPLRCPTTSCWHSRSDCYVDRAVFAEQATPMHIATAKGRLDCVTELLRFFVRRHTDYHSFIFCAIGLVYYCIIRGTQLIEGLGQMCLDKCGGVVQALPCSQLHCCSSAVRNTTATTTRYSEHAFCALGSPCCRLHCNLYAIW